MTLQRTIQIALLLATSAVLSACHVHGHVPPGQLKHVISPPPGQAKKIPE